MSQESDALEVAKLFNIVGTDLTTVERNLDRSEGYKPALQLNQSKVFRRNMDDPGLQSIPGHRPEHDAVNLQIPQRPQQPLGQPAPPPTPSQVQASPTSINNQPTVVSQVGPQNINFNITLPLDVLQIAQEKAKATIEVIQFINEVEAKGENAINIVQFLNNVIEGFGDESKYGVSSFFEDDVQSQKFDSALELLQYIITSLNKGSDNITIRRYENKNKKQEELH